MFPAPVQLNTLLCVARWPSLQTLTSEALTSAPSHEKVIAENHHTQCVQGASITEWLQRNTVASQAAVACFSALSIFMAVAWIQLFAGELVGCLQAFGIVLHCPPVLLGFLLAIVNSFGDQATNVAVAQVSGKRAAFAACFSSMSFNLAVSSVYGYLLYVQRTHEAVLPMRITPPTWLLCGALVAFLVALLLIIGMRWWACGQAELPTWVGLWARRSFAALSCVFVAQGVLDWVFR